MDINTPFTKLLLLRYPEKPSTLWDVVHTRIWGANSPRLLVG